ncbi:hypothetical protein KJ781_01235 [Patescibacteria group bacterium]|nr:hypothetical protein [Patescibacteria group bacterium]MBU1448925.1 hypothetical protein [Patescibacteria group bacterium]MBU2613722.1 hypothetical protein [Patescibacteria group bacterium]
MTAFSSGNVNRIREALQPVPPLVGPEGTRITVNEAVSRFAFLYERIRNAVDYKDEHLIRKSAIMRILKRQLMLENDPEVIADHLIRELIGARYLPNATLPESLVEDVARLVQKFQAVAKVNAGGERHTAWIREIIAVEIERTVVDSTQEKALVTFLYERLADSIRVRGAEMDETERRLQVYVACYRSLVKADNAMLGTLLLRAYLPEWVRSEEWLAEPRPIAERLVAVERRIRSRLKHRLAQKFQRAVKPWAVSIAILRDTLLEKSEDVEMLFEKPESLEIRVARKAEERYARAQARLRRGTVRATLYLFVTKMLLALVLEVPVEWFWYGKVDLFTLGVNLLFPPTLMFFVGLLIRVPGEENTARIVSGVHELLGEDSIAVREVRVPRTRRGFSGFLFTMAYAATFLITFGLIALALAALDFIWISAAIFVFFLCVVSFFGFRLRMAARETVVVEGKQGIISATMDFLSLPILRAGQWLSRSISRINVFLFIFDFLFEAPFKMFLTVLEEWFAFMKEKREELQ